MLLSPNEYLSLLTASASPGSPNTPMPDRSSCVFSKNLAQVCAAPEASDLLYFIIGCVDPFFNKSFHVFIFCVIHILLNSSFVIPRLLRISRLGLDTLVVASTASLATVIPQAP